ncbi:MAG TPA: aldo/keto reductase, partial [Thermoplasmata archaeon]|nr:aldo/keto reductase [Thermoplasmata archaeon]
VEEAVQVAVGSGRSNVVDTAINYRFQRAERSVGRALRRLCERGTVARDEIFVATKNGYLSPDAESTGFPREDVERELVSSGALRRSDLVDGNHAMSPGFLRDQFERSRTNLGLEAIDLLYLHNAADAQLPVLGKEGFFERLRDAFSTLETFRSQGHLGWYGLATWESLRTAARADVHVSLAELVGAAREVGGESHGFRFVQFPFNAFMPEAAVVRNQRVHEERCTLFQAAGRLGVGTFTSVPLLQGRLAVEGGGAPGLTRAQSAIQFARSAPGNLAPLVGQKSPDHLSENLRVAEKPPWPEAEFEAAL